jgi:hypothetical protein
MTIDSGTIAKSGDGSTAPSESLDGTYLEQVGASNHFVIGGVMPEKETLQRAREDAREGKAPSTQAGELIREEIHHVREGKHGVRNPKQAIAIGLSKARKAGVNVPSAPRGTASAKKERSRPRSKGQRPSAKRSRATQRALKKEGRSGASHRALASQTRSSSRRRSAASRSQAARKAARTRSRERASRR